MKYSQINEAIIKVPQEILGKVNTYVSSVLYYKIKLFMDNYELVLRSAPEEVRDKFMNNANNTLAKLQSKYNAKNISKETANRLMSSTIDIPFDSDKFLDELNYKSITPEKKEELRGKLKLKLRISTETGSMAVGGQAKLTDGVSFVEINISKLNHRSDFLSVVNDIMSTVYHELQHTVQTMVISNINQNSKQLQRKAGYEFGDANYYTSGVEFTPQLGNLIDLISAELESSTLKDELIPEKNKAINKALVDAVQKNVESRRFLTYIYQQDKDKYKKVMSAIYKYISQVYDEYKEKGIDYTFTEAEPEDIELNIDVMLSIRNTLKGLKEYTVTPYGKSLDSIKRIEIEALFYHMKIIKIGNAYYTVTVSSDDGDFEDKERLDSTQLLNLVGTIRDVKTSTASNIIDQIEYIKGERNEITEDNIQDMLASLEETAKQYKIDFSYNANDFSVLNHNFRIVPNGKKPTSVNIIVDGKNELNRWSLKQILIVFQMIIVLSTEEPEEVEKIITGNGVTYVDLVAKLRKL